MEKETLIGVLRHNGIITCASVGLTPADFTVPFFRRLYHYAVDVHNSGATVDLQAIRERCAGNGGLTVAEERALLKLSVEDTEIELGDAATAVKDRAERLRLALFFEKTASGLREGAGLWSSLDEVKREVEKRALRTVKGCGPGEAMAAAINYFDQDTISTGFPRLDAVFAGGPRPGEVLVIGARPGGGKSLLTLRVLSNVAQDGNRAGLITLEMSAASLELRRLAWESKIPHEVLRKKVKSLQGTSAVKQAMERLESHPITYVKPPAKYDEVVRAVHGLAASGCRMIGVDYLQLIRDRGYRGNRSDELSEVSAGLKNIAEHLGVSLVEAVQLRRPHPQAKDKPPEMDDIKDCGAIEQDADFVGLLWEDRAFNRDGSDLRFIKLLIRKYRSGAALNYITYEFDPAHLDLRECPIGG